MPSLKASYKTLALSCLVLITAGCSVEKNTRASRYYQSLTAHYNIYFNGIESFKAGVEKVNKGYVDDYADLLRVFEFSDPAAPARCSADMERAVQKASKLISLKSMTVKPEVKDKTKITPEEQKLLDRKEYNEWVDDSYLLIGKARFYKQEYKDASAVFDYCIKEANDPYIKKEAAIWLARTYDENANYSEALRTLREMNLANERSNNIKSMYYSTMADMYIKQKEYPEAIDPLGKAIKLVSGKRPRYRLTYLLAQLNERSGNSEQAISLYRQVVKMNPPYDVEFNARINIAGVFDINSGNPKEIRKELNKMLGDSKNKDFQDQIYYTLGSLSMKEGNEKAALEYFRESASSKSSNQNQRGRTYLALADYYFSKSDFIKAGKYYDSTVVFYDQKNPDFKLIKLKSLNLNAVVSQLEIIQKEDSLQKIAAMPESQRNAVISGIIDNLTQAENQGKNTDNKDRYNVGQYYENQMRYQNNIDQEGKWYFYNQTALAFGRSEFKRRWGDRKLEDNWRMANKSTMSTAQVTGGTEEKTQTARDTTKTALDYKNPKYYLKNLPLTDSLLAISNNKIANAYLNAGKAYAEKLTDPARATQYFEKLIARYPASELIPETLYNLYKTNKDTDKAKSEVYRQKLLEKYPSTEFAKILSDPEYYQKKIETQKIVEKNYDKAYDSFKSEDFTSTIAICDTALKEYSQDKLAPKFMLLRAYCVARTGNEKNFVDELNKVVKSWPGTSESARAGDIIAYLKQKRPELKIAVDKEIAKELYTVDTVSTQCFILIIEDAGFNINQASFDVISYNIDNFTNKNYKTEGILAENQYIMITVSGFKTYSEAMFYYKGFDAEKNIRNISKSKTFSFVIGKENLTVMNKDKDPERYLLFFNEHNLNGEKNKH
ncbi:MAG: tetratricopeptide repeat protein [Bacteroidales bacterium]